MLPLPLSCLSTVLTTHALFRSLGTPQDHIPPWDQPGQRDGVESDQVARGCVHICLQLNVFASRQSTTTQGDAGNLVGRCAVQISSGVGLRQVSGRGVGDPRAHSLWYIVVHVNGF
ncbi:hypothetical protein C8Q72DRAFT_800077 [Fomitopsis betulina]|nr:hypothetical protein C8Q72DRAFT_800077 [Fomitopsis betulina]